MDGTKRKKKPFEFAEGHKRETRKSYQSFIEGTSKISSPPLLLNIKTEDLADEWVRKSSRKPVPKKSFELVDVFEKKSTPLKNSCSSKQKDSVFLQSSIQDIEIHIKQEIDEDQDLAPRKSNRVPVPKKCFDLIDPNLKGGMAVIQQDSNKTNVPVQMEKKSKKSKTKKASVVNSEAEGKSHTEKIKKAQHDKNSNKMNSLGDALAEKQKHDHEKREKSKFKLKLDFKAKKDKGSRKRKLPASTNNLSSNKNSDVFEKEGPNEKVAKVVEDNIDKSSLMEALQALKQPLENLPMEEDEKAKLGKKSNLSGSEVKAQKPRGKKQASKAKKSASNDSSTVQQMVEASGGEGKDENNKGKTGSLSPQKGWDYSSSTTEISDGHVILKLGGLNSPNKVKKHKKKHKHGHHGHNAEVSNEESNKGAANSHGSNEVKLNVPNESPNDQHKIISPSENDTSGKESVVLSEDKEKKNKNHKKKRKLSQSDSQEPPKKVSLDTKKEKDKLTVKKRKIYKKKKGEKILVRIQTEFWNKNGELVKVESMDVKDGRPGQPKEKKVVKPKKGQSLMTDPVVSAGQADVELMKHSVSDSGSGATNQDSKGDQNSKTKKKQSKLSSDEANVKPTTPKSVENKSKLNTNTKKGVNNTNKKKKERKTQTLTAYLLYCRKYRPKVVSEHPEIGFSEISKKLAQMWNEAPEKEKDIYKKQLEEHRAKVNASIRKETSKKLKTTKQNDQGGPEKYEKGHPNSGRMSSREYQIAPQKYSVLNLEPLDMGAHLQLLGESLMLVGTALRRQILTKSSDLKVYGSLSVLLDSSLCAMAPLLFLTSCVPELDVIPPTVKANTLDSISYILPGL